MKRRRCRRPEGCVYRRGRVFWLKWTDAFGQTHYRSSGSHDRDVAGGTAEGLRRIAERWQVDATGYDTDAELIERAKSRSPELSLLVADEPPPGPFDLVV